MKLVRDRIPDIIRSFNREGEFYIAPGDEFRSRLFDKLTEEIEEFIVTPSLEEAADILEVFKAIVEIHDMEMIDVCRAARDKELTNGAFDRGLVFREPEDTDDEWREQTKNRRTFS